MSVQTLIDNLVLDKHGKKYHEDFNPQAYGDTLRPGSDPADLLYREIVNFSNPSLIIEVGSYLGYSAIGMAKRIKEKNLNCKVICVDTFLGGPDHFFLYRQNPDDVLGYKNGYPSLYYKFISNVIIHGVQDIIYPLPFPSTVGFAILDRLMKEHEVQADAIYIDGSHEAQDVYMDLHNYYQLLKPGGLLVGDDWAWETVREGVGMFLTANGLEDNLTVFTNNIHWTIKK